MALKKCSECAKEISEKAVSCPHCGAPNTTAAAEPAPKKEKRKTSPIAWVALIAIVVGIGWYSQSREFKEQSLPGLPVEVTFRESLMGKGLVLSVKNASSKPLMVVAKLKNPTTQESKAFRLDISPNESEEIGHREGWTLASGDLLELTNENYRTRNSSIP